MIELLQNSCSSMYEHFGNITTSVTDSATNSIKLIARYNFKLIALSLTCAYFRDYNLVLGYVIAGAVFHKHIPKIEETINSIFRAPTIILCTFLKPIIDLEICNISFSSPIKKVIGGGVVLIEGFLCLLWGPITLIAAEAFLALNCGANIAKVSRKIAREHDLIKQ